MCKQISDLIYKFSIWWIFLLASLIFLLFTLIVLPIQSAKTKAEYGDIGSPDLSFYYTADDLYQMAEAYGEVGRLSYIKTRFTFDLLWPLVYTVFLVTGISWVTRKAYAPHSLMLRANLAPLLGALFDYLENISASLVMLRYPTKTGVVAGMVTVFTMMKWVLLILSFLLLLIGLVRVIRAWLKS